MFTILGLFIWAIVFILFTLIYAGVLVFTGSIEQGDVFYKMYEHWLINIWTMRILYVLLVVDLCIMFINQLIKIFKR